MAHRYATTLALLLALVLLVGCGGAYGGYYYADHYWYDDPYWYDEYYWYGDYYWFAPSGEGLLEVESPERAPRGAAW